MSNVYIPMTGHEAYLDGLLGVYQYDCAEDGPECEVITRILARHPIYVPGEEKCRLDKHARGRQ